MNLNRRHIVTAIPALASFGLLASSPVSSLAQSTSSPTSLATVSADYKKSSTSIAATLLSSIQAAVANTSNGVTPSTYVQSVSASYSMWIANLAQVGYFSDLNSVISIDPNSILQTPVPSWNLTSSLTLAKQIGLPTPTLAVYSQDLNSIQTSMTPGELQQQASGGSQALFAQLGNELTGIMVGTIPAARSSQSGVTPDHSGDCNAFAYLGIIAGLTGNEIAAAICAYELYENC